MPLGQDDNGQWVMLTDEDFFKRYGQTAQQYLGEEPPPPAAPPPPASTGAGGFSAGLLNQANNLGGATVTPSIWEQSPELAYRQSLGIGGSALNPYQRWLRDLFGDVQSAWQVGQTMNPSTTPTTFQDYMGQQGVGGARNFWQGASGSMLNQDKYNQMGTVMNQGDVGSALANAMRYKYGPGSIYGSYLARQMPEASQFYNAQYETAPETTGNFLDYLRQRYGL